MALNESQRRRLADMERESFLRSCRRIGCSPSQREATILEAAQRELSMMLEALAFNPARLSDFTTQVESYLSAQDLWALKRNQTQREMSNVADRIVAHRFSLPINWCYLDQLSADLVLPTPCLDNGNSLRDFLQSLCHIRLYENNFNAFVESGTLLDKIPCVCVYELLLTACEFFLDVLVKGMFRISSVQGEVQLHQLEPEQLREVGEGPAFIRACHECLEMVLGHKHQLILYPEDLATRANPDLAIIAKVMASGCQTFVWYHEYGHLLQGHLTIGPCHEVEHGADSFAWQLIHSDAEYQHGEFAFWYRVGALSVFAIISLIEIISRAPETPTHPTALQRLGSVIRTIEGEGPQLSYPSGAVLVLCEATVQEFYGISYTV